MKKLYLLLVMLCVAVASWAQDYTLTDATWYAGNPQEVQGKFGLEGNQKAVCVNVTAGHLSEAVEGLSGYLMGVSINLSHSEKEELFINNTSQ